MQITLDLPEWTNQKQTLRIFAGIELVAYKLPDEKWQVKTSRCNMCGKCCMNFKEGRHIFPLIDGRCIHLTKEAGNNDRWLCKLGLLRPFGCSAGLGKDFSNDCVESFEEVK